MDIVCLFSNHRNKLQDEAFEQLETLAGAPTEQHNQLSRQAESQLFNLTCNFLSSEFLKLMIDLLSISNEQKLNASTQYQASEAVKSVFNYSSRLVFKTANFSELVYDNLEVLTKNYYLEIRELINALSSDSFAVREVGLLCLESLNAEREKCSNKIDLSERFLLDNETHTQLNHLLWVSLYDVAKSNRILAGKIWDQSDQFVIDKNLCYLLVDDVVHPIESMRLAAAEALADAIKQNNKSIIPSVLKMFFLKYAELSQVKEPKKDQFGRVLNEEVFDDWEARAGIASALAYLAESVPNDDAIVLELFTFFVYKALNDTNTAVKNKMLEASIVALNFHGRSHINSLLPLFEKFLVDAPKLASYDSVRQNVVILMGTLAKHLDKDDEKVAPIIDKLIQALQTPSQQVQEAVSKCLPPLIPSIKSQVPNYVNQLLNSLLSAQTYGERRGAAYGLAGILKGVGMLSLRQLNVLQRLNDAVNNKSDAKQREGALLAYEMLTIMFSKVFEPYSVEILPNLLLCFGDSDANVRQAADDCAKATMANLTFTGVKMILPKLLERYEKFCAWNSEGLKMGLN